MAPLGVLLFAVLPAAAPAATLGLDQRCYVTGEQAAISGSGFLPTTSLVLTRGGDTLSPVPSDNSGAFRGTIAVPAIPSDVIETQVEVTATDGTSTAHSYLNITRGIASFTPTVGDLRTLRVRHTVSGFGLSESRPSVYLHYVSPAAQVAQKKSADAAARSRAGATLSNVQKTGGSTVAAADPAGVKTIRLGQLRGPCGVLRTSPRKLFPFKVTDGTWLIQYDTNPRYVAGTSSSSFFWVARKVTIKS
ncbi:MAG: hypothetical protein J7513_11155 [Solirubrobacteraceae bacterium]|nr:hypothetical protein [Solirubrobacteraceae bacterium]